MMDNKNEMDFFRLVSSRLNGGGGEEKEDVKVAVQSLISLIKWL